MLGQCQYSRRKCSGIPESVSDKTLEDKIQGVLGGIDVEVDTLTQKTLNGAIV